MNELLKQSLRGRASEPSVVLPQKDPEVTPPAGTGGEEVAARLMERQSALEARFNEQIGLIAAGLEHINKRFDEQAAKQESAAEKLQGGGH